jgi:hypothetical protein
MKQKHNGPEQYAHRGAGQEPQKWKALTSLHYQT